MRNENAERTAEQTVERGEELIVLYQFDTSPQSAELPDDREIGPMPKNPNTSQKILWLIESMANPRAHGVVNTPTLAAAIVGRLNSKQREHCVMMQVMRLVREDLEATF